jgi:hypothetical protein
MPLQLLGVTKAQAAAAKRAERPVSKASRAAWSAAPATGAAAAAAAAAAGTEDERPLSAAAAGELLADVLTGYNPRPAPAAASAYDPNATADPGPPKGVADMKYPIRQLPDGSWEATLLVPPTKIPSDDTTYMTYYLEVPSDE